MLSRSPRRLLCSNSQTTAASLFLPPIFCLGVDWSSASFADGGVRFAWGRWRLCLAAWLRLRLRELPWLPCLRKRRSRLSSCTTSINLLSRCWWMLITSWLGSSNWSIASRESSRRSTAGRLSTFPLPMATPVGSYRFRQLLSLTATGLFCSPPLTRTILTGRSHWRFWRRFALRTTQLGLARNDLGLIFCLMKNSLGKL